MHIGQVGDVVQSAGIKNRLNGRLRFFRASESIESAHLVVRLDWRYLIYTLDIYICQALNKATFLAFFLISALLYHC